jgi:undecaprenyl-diphosphatase
MDADLTRWINSFAGANAVLDSAMIALTQYGVPLIVVLVVLQWWSGTNRRHVRHAAICAGLSFLAGLAVNQIILLFVHRVRPFDAGVSHLLIARSADWSFPSDHATAVAAVVAAFGIQRLHWKAGAFGVLALLVCFSRVYVGTHYVTDILGGVAVGILAAHAVALAFREGTRLDRFLTGIL